MKKSDQEILGPDNVVRSVALSTQGLINGTSTRMLGNMSFARDLDGTAPGNFSSLLEKLHISSEKHTILFPKLTHSSNVALVRRVPGRVGRLLIDQNSPEVVTLAKFNGINPPADFIAEPHTGMDACISDSLDTFLAILPADCAPVMLYDPDNNYYAIIHAGVLGALSGIVLNTVECMRLWCGSVPARLICYIGPCVTSGAYNLKQSGLWNSVLKNQLSHDVAENFELKNLIVKQLGDIGVPPSHIGVSAYCTGGDDRMFFSNYSAKTAEEKKVQGRHLSILGRACR